MKRLLALYQKINDFIFGYDFFISYAWKDGRTYAEKLKNQLANLTYVCFLDSEDYVKGGDWKIAGKRALKKTGKLILVGTPGAIQSKPVLREIRIFSKRNREIIPIDIAQTRETTSSDLELMQLIGTDTIWIPEPEDQLTNGPTTSIIQEIHKSFNLTKQNSKRLRIAIVVSIVLLLLTLSTAGFAIYANEKKNQALRNLAQAFLQKSENALMEKDPLTAEVLAAKGLTYDDTFKLRKLLARAQGYNLTLGWVSAHANDVGHEAISWSPDGEWLASDGPDNTISIWEASSGKQIADLVGHKNIVELAWNPKDQHIASASSDGTIIIWDVERREILHTLYGDRKAVWGLSWSPDGDRLASVGSSGIIRIWDAATALEIVSAITGKTNEYTETIYGVEWAPDGKRIVLCGTKNVLIYDELLASEPHTLKTTINGAQVCTWSPDGELIAVAGALREEDITGRIELWRTDSLERTATLDAHSFTVFGLAWSPSGTLFVSTSGDGTALVWSVEQEEPIAVLRGQNGRIVRFNGTAWSPKGFTFATTSKSGLMLWDAQRKGLIFSVAGHDSPISALTWNPDGTTLAAADWQGNVIIWSPLKGAQVSRLKAPDVVSDIAWHPEQPLLAITGRGWSDQKPRRSIGETTVWDLTTDSTASMKRSLSEGRALSWSPDGEQLVTLDQDGTLTELQINNKHWRKLPLESKLPAETTSGMSTIGHSANGLALDPKGERIAHTWGNNIYVWNRVTGKQIALLEGHSADTKVVSWSPDGTIIATASIDKTVRLWDAKRYKLLQILRGHQGAINDLDWSQDGRLLASGSSDNTVRVWEPELGLLLIAKGPTSSVERVSWRPDGMRLAAGTKTGSLFVWEIEIRTFAGHKRPISQVAWSPNGQQVASSSFDSEIRLWQMPEGKAIHSSNSNYGQPSLISWSPKSKQLSSADRDGVVRLLSTAPSPSGRNLWSKNEYVHAMSWSPDTAILAVLTNSGSLLELDSKNGKELNSSDIRPNDNLFHSFNDRYKFVLSWRNQEWYLAAAWTGVEGGVAAWNKKQQKPIWEFKFDQGANTVAWSPDGRFVATRSKLHPIEIRDGSSGSVLRRFEQTAELDNISELLWDQKGHYLACVGSSAITILDVKTGRTLQILERLSYSAFMSASWGPHADFIATGSGDAMIRIIPTKLDVYTKTPEGLMSDAQIHTRLQIRNFSAELISQNQLQASWNGKRVATWASIASEQGRKAGGTGGKKYSKDSH